MLPKVKFEVFAGLYCDFLNALTEKGVLITDIKATEYGFTAICTAIEYKIIARLAKKYQCRTKLLEKRGICFKTKSYTTQKGLVVGIVIIFITLFLSQKLIWRIDVIADNQNIAQDITTLLYSNDIYPGAVYSKEEKHKAVQQIFMEVENVGYVTLNFYKGILICKVDTANKKLPYLEESTAGNITAAQDGILEDIRVYSGFSSLQKGQTVNKGDILVTATYTDRNGNLQQVMPRAYIKALCTKKYSVKVMFSKSEYIRTGKSSKRITLKFLNRSFTVKKEDVKNFISFDTEKTAEQAEIAGFKLPLTVETVQYYEKQQIDIERNEATAKTVARKNMDTVIQADKALLSAESKKYTYSVNEKGVTLYCFVTGYYDITK